MAVLNENYPKIRNLNSLNEVDELINFILDILGVKSLDEDLDEHNRKVKFIFEFIISKFGFLTIPEIKESFKMYVAKDFGHCDIYRTLDSIVVSDVLNCFIDFRSEKLRVYTQKKKTEEMLEQSKLNPIDVDKLMIDAVNNKYSEYLELKTIAEPTEHIFKELIDRKLIKMPSDENPKLYDYYDRKLQAAKSQIKRELDSEKPLNPKETNRIKEELQNIINNNSSLSQVRAKKLVLLDFFKKQNELGKTNIL